MYLILLNDSKSSLTTKETLETAITNENEKVIHTCLLLFFNPCNVASVLKMH